MIIDVVEATKPQNQGKVKVSLDGGITWRDFLVDRGYLCYDNQYYGAVPIKDTWACVYKLMDEPPSSATTFGLKLLNMVDNKLCSAFSDHGKVQYDYTWQKIPGKGVFVADDYSASTYSSLGLGGVDRSGLVLVLVECREKLDTITGHGVSTYRWCRVVLTEHDAWNVWEVRAKLTPGLCKWIDQFGKKVLLPEHFGLLNPVQLTPKCGDIIRYENSLFMVIPNSIVDRTYTDVKKYLNLLGLVSLTNGSVQYFADVTDVLHKIENFGNAEDFVTPRLRVNEERCYGEKRE